MEKEVKYIRFDLENCEDITINVKDIVEMRIGNLTETHKIYPLDKFKTIVKSYDCSYLYICISKNARVTGNCWGSPVCIERLINFNDIVDIVYLDGNKEEELMKIYVPYDDNAHEDNLNQSYRYDSRDNLEILIKREEKDEQIDSR